MIDFAEARKIAGMLAAVGEPTRMLVLHRLTEGPRHVGQLAELVGVPMVNMSHHLGVMRQAGLIEDVKQGRRVVYSLHPDVFAPAADGDTLGVLRLGSFRLTLVRVTTTGRRARKPTPPADGVDGQTGRKAKKADPAG